MDEEKHVLEELKKLCEYIEEAEPKRKALSNDALARGARQGRFLYMPMDIKKPLRDGVVFYSTGWGWRLRKYWEMSLEGKLQEAEAC